MTTRQGDVLLNRIDAENRLQRRRGNHLIQPGIQLRLLGVLNALLSPSQEVAIVGDPQEAATQALLDQVRQRYLPTTVLALKRPNEESMLPLLEGRTLVDGKAAAYVCENYACQLPVTTAEALGRLL